MHMATAGFRPGETLEIGSREAVREAVAACLAERTPVRAVRAFFEVLEETAAG